MTTVAVGRGLCGGAGNPLPNEREQREERLGHEREHQRDEHNYTNRFQPNMAPSLKLLCAALLLSSLLLRGFGSRCGLSTIRVVQRTTGERSGLDYEFTVEVTNACSSACGFQSNVRLHAPGFMSQKPVDPRRFRPDGAAGTFLVNDGNPIPAGAAVKFTYWWDHAAYFSPAGSQASAC